MQGGYLSVDRASLTRSSRREQWKVAALDRSRRDPGDRDARHSLPSAPSPPLLRGDAPARPGRLASAARGSRLMPHPPTDPSPFWPRAGGGRCSRRGARVTPENFPGTGHAGDFHSHPRGPRSGVVLGGHLGLPRDRGWGLRDSCFFHFPLPPLHIPRRPGSHVFRSPLPLGFVMAG